MNGGGGGTVEFAGGAEPPVPTGAVTRGPVVSGTLVREEDLRLPVRSPKEFVNSSSSIPVELILGIGVTLGIAVKLAVGNSTPPLPVDKRTLVAAASETFSKPEETGIVPVKLMVLLGFGYGVKLGPVTAEKFEEGCTTPPPDATEDRAVAPEVTNSRLPLDIEPFNVGLGTALTDTGSDTFTDGCGMEPVDAISGESVLSSVGVSSENWKAPNEPPPSSSASVPFELGVGTSAEAVSDMTFVGPGAVMFADAGGMKPDAPVERKTAVESDTEMLPMLPTMNTLALEIGVWLTRAVPDTPVEFEVDAVDCTEAGLPSTELVFGEL